jgi:hypothetical protein
MNAENGSIDACCGFAGQYLRWAQDARGPLIPQIDRRMGGVITHVFAQEGELMRLPREVERSAAFIGILSKGQFIPKGTVFFVAYPCGPDKRWNYEYAVTARHTVEKIHKDKYSDDGEPYIRLNLRGADASVFRLSRDNWVFHGDDSVDVAVASVVLPDGRDHPLIKTASFATEEVIQNLQIGSGNELFFPGLFTSHFGMKRNIPIVRRGTIASMPQEKVLSEGLERELYLVEARSIGGLSGSPVFVNLGPSEPVMKWHPNRPVPPDIAELQLGPSYLLGLIHGHFTTKNVEDYADASEEDIAIIQGLKSMNMGIGMVVPAKHILSVLDSDPAIVRIRDEAVRQKCELEKANGTELD